MVSITHKKVLLIADDNSASAAGEVLPSNWNDEHSVSFCNTWTIDSLVVTNAQFLATASFVDVISSGIFTVNGRERIGATASLAFPIAGLEIDSGLNFNFPNGWGNNLKLSNDSVPALWFQGTSASVGLIYAWWATEKQFWMEVTDAGGFTTATGRVIYDFSASAYYPGADGGMALGKTGNRWGSLKVAGAADISATLSVGALLVAGSPVVSNSAFVKLGSTTGFAGVNVFKMSGDWSSYQALDLSIQAKGAAATTNLIILLYTDGGTTPFMTFATNPVASATASEVAASFKITGSRNQNAMKIVFPEYQMFAGVTNQAGQFPTATFTASAINAIGIITGTGTTTTTMSSGDIFLYGRGV